MTPRLADAAHLGCLEVPEDLQAVTQWVAQKVAKKVAQCLFGVSVSDNRTVLVTVLGALSVCFWRALTHAR